MAHRSERRLRLLVGATFVAGVLLSIWAWPRVGLPTAAAFVAAVALTELLPARMRDGVLVSLCSVVAFSAVLVGGPALAICSVAGLPLVAWRCYGDRRMQRTLFNFGQMAASVAAAGALYLTLGGSVGQPQRPWNWVALLISGVAFTLVNPLLVALAIRLSSGEGIRSTMRSLVASSLLLQALYAGLSILAAALLVGTGPASVVFLVVPALVARHALLGIEREAQAYDRLVSALLTAIEAKDGYTRGHTERVATLCVEVGREFGFGYASLRVASYAAKLHDVGKLGVPTAILNKPATLDEEEFALIRAHPTLGAEILAGIDFLHPALAGVRYHHERVDGAGYPHRISGDDLLLLPRIITVCDAFDAMTTTRPYRRAMPLEAAFAELRRCAGTQFDRGVVEVLEGVVKRLDWTVTDAPDRPAAAVKVAPA